VEKQAAEAAASMRAVESTLNSRSSDMRLVREILQRLEDNGRQREPLQLRR
jgi:ribosomal protein L18E